MLMDYHIFFMAMSFCLLIFTVYLIFLDEKTKQGIMAAMFLCGFNWLLCLTISFGFFGIGIIGYGTDGSIEITPYADMFYVFAIFFMLQFANVVLMFLCFYHWTRKAWDLDRDTSTKTKEW